MDTNIAKMRMAVEAAKRNQTEAERRLSEVVRNCKHTWGKTVADHIYHEGYMIHGDRPGDAGYGGVDRQFDCYVPSKTDHRWKRTCQTCGEVQYTTKTTQEVTEHPTFN
jgi:hypothetical protein